MKNSSRRRVELFNFSTTQLPLRISNNACAFVLIQEEKIFEQFLILGLPPDSLASIQTKLLKERQKQSNASENSSQGGKA